MIVVDSVAALTPRAELEGEMGDTHVGLQARLMSQALRKLTRQVAKRLEDLAAKPWLWHGLHAKLVDGSTLTMPDTPENADPAAFANADPDVAVGYDYTVDNPGGPLFESIIAPMVGGDSFFDVFFEIEVPGQLPINLDGEPYRWDRVRFEVKPKALHVVLPEGCPVIQGA